MPPVRKLVTSGGFKVLPGPELDGRRLRLPSSRRPARLRAAVYSAERTDAPLRRKFEEIAAVTLTLGQAYSGRATVRQPWRRRSGRAPASRRRRTAVGRRPTSKDGSPQVLPGRLPQLE